jgi:hypothetical protein
MRKSTYTSQYLVFVAQMVEYLMHGLPLEDSVEEKCGNGADTETRPGHP